MKFHMTREWLVKRLDEGDSVDIAAGGTSFEKFRDDLARKTVTPSVLKDAPTDIAKVIRFVREQRSWTRSEMAQLADIDETELASIESDPLFDPEPRTVGQLADLCGFSPILFAQLARHRRSTTVANDANFAFAASSNGTNAVSEDEYAIVCALIEILSERAAPSTP